MSTDPALTRVLLGMLLTLAGTAGIVLTLAPAGERARGLLYGLFVWIMAHTAIVLMAVLAAHAGWFR